ASARMRGCARFGAGALVTRTIHDWSDQQRPEGESGDPEEFHAGEESKRHAQWQPRRGIVGTGGAQRRYGVAAPARNPPMFPLISARAHAVQSGANKLRKQNPRAGVGRLGGITRGPILSDGSAVPGRTASQSAPLLPLLSPAPEIKDVRL